MTTFDEALVKECYRRDQSIVPQQALALSNSRLVLDSAVRIAERIGREGQGGRVEEQEFIEQAFQQILGIRADESMVGASRRAMERWRSLPEDGKGQGSSIPDRIMPDRIMLVWSLLNHNDFVTLR